MYIFTFGTTAYAFLLSKNYNLKLPFILNQNGKEIDADFTIAAICFLLTIFPIAILTLKFIEKTIKCSNCNQRVNYKIGKTKIYECEHCNAIWKT